MEYTPLAVIALAALTGCPAGETGAGTLTVRWKMQNIDGTPAPCPSGYDKMRVSAAGFTEEWRESLPTYEVPTVAIFNCAAGTGVIELPGGTDYTGIYSVWFENTDASDSIVYMTDHHFDTGHAGDKFHVDVASGDASLTIPMYPKDGFIRLEWSFMGVQVAENLHSCADAGADRIEISFVEEQGATSMHSFACNDDREGLDLLGSRTVGGAVYAMKAGYYTMRAKAFSGSTQVGDTAPQRAGETDERVDDKNRITPVLPAEFTLYIPNR